MATRVSVIIPVCNGDRFIAQAIESVLAQTYTNYEIIVVDDGSTDDSSQILQPYFDRIRYIYQNNQGVAVARNHGIGVAKGDLVAFLDQDDLFLPDKLALQVQCFEEQPELGIANSGWTNVNHKGDRLANVEPWHDLPQLDAESWIVWKPVFPGALMIKRSWLLQAGGFDARFHQTSDVDLVLRLALMGCKADWTKQVTVCYRQHQANTSRNVVQQVEELKAVLNNFFERPDLPDEVRKLEKRSRYQSLIWSAWRMYQQGPFEEVAILLEQSLQYSSDSWTTIVLDWVESFRCYAAESREKFDLQQLIQSSSWQALMYRTQSSSKTLLRFHSRI